jgi:hypothetical protein
VLAPQLVLPQALLLVQLLVVRALVLVLPAVLLLVLVLPLQLRELQHTKPHGSLLLAMQCSMGAEWPGQT